MLICESNVDSFWSQHGHRLSIRVRFTNTGYKSFKLIYNFLYLIINRKAIDFTSPTLCKDLEADIIKVIIPTLATGENLYVATYGNSSKTTESEWIQVQDRSPASKAVC